MKTISVKFEVNFNISDYFPFYHTIYDNGYIKGCIKSSAVSCKECVCKTFCLIKGE
jgi:hypothetical protein